MTTRIIRQTDSLNLTDAFHQALEHCETFVKGADPDSNLWAVGSWELEFKSVLAKKDRWRDERPSYFYTFVARAL